MAPFRSGADGVVLGVATLSALPSTTPSARANVASRHLLTAQPPLLGEEGSGYFLTSPQVSMAFPKYGFAVFPFFWTQYEPFSYIGQKSRLWPAGSSIVDTTSDNGLKAFRIAAILAEPAAACAFSFRSPWLSLANAVNAVFAFA